MSAIVFGCQRRTTKLFQCLFAYRFSGHIDWKGGAGSCKLKDQRYFQSAFVKRRPKKQFEFLQSLNKLQLERFKGDERLEATIESFELAYRMQMNAPGIMDLSQETASMLESYGINDKATEDFGRQCLMARRLAESNVRYIQINYADNSTNPRWDQHSDMPKHAQHAKAVDKPVAGLLADLEQRGLLEDTLVWWGGEFGRTPFAQGKDGRDHNPRGFTVWLAGGGVKAGYSHGTTG